MTIFQRLTIKKRLIYLTFAVSLVGVGGMVSLAIQPPKPIVTVDRIVKQVINVPKPYPVVTTITKNIEVVKYVTRVKKVKVYIKPKPKHYRTGARCPVGIVKNDQVTCFFNKVR
jgi:hypothetical protein